MTACSGSTGDTRCSSAVSTGAARAGGGGGETGGLAAGSTSLGAGDVSKTGARGSAASGAASAAAAEVASAIGARIGFVPRVVGRHFAEHSAVDDVERRRLYERMPTADEILADVVETGGEEFLALA